MTTLVFDHEVDLGQVNLSLIINAIANHSHLHYAPSLYFQTIKKRHKNESLQQANVVDSHDYVGFIT